jgi:hypothetical protein
VRVAVDHPLAASEITFVQEIWQRGAISGSRFASYTNAADVLDQSELDRTRLT